MRNKPNNSSYDARVAAVHPKGSSATPKPWDTSKGRTWVVVAFWGVETTVSFYRNEADAYEGYEEAVNNGADAFYAKTMRMKKSAD